MYNSVCKHEFDGIKTDCQYIKDDVSAIKTKVYNGFGDSIFEIKKDLEELKKQQDKSDNRQWATLIGLFMILAAILVPKLIPDRPAHDVSMERVVYEYQTD
jgi:hypothetical protein